MNKLLEILEEFDNLSICFNYGERAVLRKFLSEKLVEYARSKVPQVSDISKHKTEVGKQFPKASYIEENGWNSAVAEIRDRIDQDILSIQDKDL